jgi:hypothetical protein
VLDFFVSEDTFLSIAFAFEQERLGEERHKRAVRRLWKEGFGDLPELECEYDLSLSLSILPPPLTRAVRVEHFTVCKSVPGSQRMPDEVYDTFDRQGEGWIACVLGHIAHRKRLEAHKGVEPQGCGEMFMASYAIVMACPEEVLAGLQIQKDCLLDLIALCSIMPDGDLAPILLGIETFARRWDLYRFFDLKAMQKLAEGQAPPDLKDVSVSGIGKYVLDVIAVAIICRMLNITEAVGDFSSIKPFVVNSVTKGASDVIQYLTAVVKVLVSGDFTDFSSRVREFVVKGRRDVVDLLAVRYREVNDPVIQSWASVSHMAKIDVLLTRIGEEREKSVALKHSYDVASLIDLDLKVRGLQAKVRGDRESVRARKEPLLFLCNSKAGSGKSVISNFMVNGLARALDVPLEDAETLNYFWATYENFQERFSDSTRMISFDELMSVNVDYDPQAGTLLGTLLQIVSPNPMSIPQAFESKKGTLTTAKVLLCQVNSNAEDELFKTMYAGKGDNFFRRAHKVTVTYSKLLTGFDGKLDLGKVKSELLTSEFFDENIMVKIERWNDVKQAYEVKLESGVLGLSEYVYNEVKSRISGDFAAHSAALREVQKWNGQRAKPNLVQAQSLPLRNETGIPETMALFGSGLAFSQVCMRWFQLYAGVIGAHAGFRELAPVVPRGAGYPRLKWCGAFLVFWYFFFLCTWPHLGWHNSWAWWHDVLYNFATTVWVFVLWYEIIFDTCMYRLEAPRTFRVVFDQMMAGDFPKLLGAIAIWPFALAVALCETKFGWRWQTHQLQPPVPVCVVLWCGLVCTCAWLWFVCAFVFPFYFALFASLWAYEGNFIVNPAVEAQAPPVVVEEDVDESRFMHSLRLLIVVLFLTCCWYLPGVTAVLLLAAIGIYYLVRKNYILVAETMITGGRNLYMAAWMWYVYGQLLRTFVFVRGDGFQGVVRGTGEYTYNFLRSAFRKINELFENPWVKRVVLASAGIAIASYLRSGKKEKVKEVQSQGFLMPRIADPEYKVGVEESLREMFGTLVAIKEVAPSEGVVRQMLPAGQGMQMSALDRIRRNYMAYTILEVDGKDVGGSTGNQVCMRVGGMSRCMGHGWPVKFQNVTVRLTDPYVPGSSVVFLVHFDSVKRVANQGLYFPSIFPEGKGDLERTFTADGGAAPKGSKVVMLGYDQRSDLYGEIVGSERVSFPSIYPGEPAYFEDVCVVLWEDGKRTKVGDCGFALFRISGPTYVHSGFLTAGQVMEPFHSYFKTPPVEGMKKEFESVLGKVALVQGTPLWSVPGTSLVEELPDAEVLLQYPKSGVMAYAVSRDKCKVHVVGTSPVQTPPSKSQLKPSPFMKAATEALKEFCPNKTYRTPMLQTEVRFDTEIGANRYVSPYEVGMDRTRNPGVFMVDGLKELAAGLTRHLEAGVLLGEGKPYNLDEVFARLPDMAPVDPTRAASEGEKGKKGSFMEEVQYFDGTWTRRADDRLRATVENRMHRLARGEILPGRSSTFTKDELISAEKHESGATRLFESEPFSNNVMNRMFIGPMRVKMLKVMRKLGSMIGINASSPEWVELQRRLSPTVAGEFARDADFKKFDKYFEYVLQMLVHHAIWRALVKFYNAKTDFERFLACLLLMEMRVLRLVDGAWVFSYPGNISGWFLTTEVNTLVNMCLWFMAYWRVFKLSFDEFVDKVCSALALYGDDVAKVERFWFSDVMTADRLVREMAYLGQVITSLDFVKGELKDTGDVTFLKRRFNKVDENHVYAPLELSSVLKSLLAFKPCGDEKRDWERHWSTVQQAWEEAFMHQDANRDVIRGVCLKCLKYFPPEYERRSFKSDLELKSRWEAGEFKVWQL